MAYRAKKGLEDIICDSTAISDSIGETSELLYRGYPIEDLSENCVYDETALLVLEGELPSKERLILFRKQNIAIRQQVAPQMKLLDHLPASLSPLKKLSIAVLALEENSNYQADEVILAAMPLLAAKICTQIPAGTFGPTVFNPQLDEADTAKFFLESMLNKPMPEKAVAAFDKTMTVYAEQGFNPSTFTARIVTSTRGDVYSAISAAIGALSGSLHGGANQEAIKMLRSVPSVAEVDSWLAHQLKSGGKLMGFGHRIFRNGDPRAPLMKRCRDMLARLSPASPLPHLADALEIAVYREKELRPNLDYSAAVAYELLGLPDEIFTVIFAVARTAGWLAHIKEQKTNNRLIRPMAEYTGPEKRHSRP
ncbi:MAG: citrate/2-methylcitrate synthase [bacterium]|nr:citrate/2-methylcitrate synthase [bacterium]